MKKLVFMLLALGLFIINAQAADLPSKCPKWEHGQVVYYNGIPQNTPGTAPSSFCWDAVEIDGDDGIYNGYRYHTETLTSSQSLAD
jgi:hypothetical protein